MKKAVEDTVKMKSVELTANRHTDIFLTDKIKKLN